MLDKNYFYLYIIITSFVKLPSTFIHEIAHIVFALLLGGRVKGFSLIPSKDESGFFTFGEVLIGARYPGIYFLIGLAPIVWILLAFFIYTNNIVIINKHITFVIILYLIGGGIPSYQDMFLAFKGLFSMSGIVILFLLICTVFVYSKMLN